MFNVRCCRERFKTKISHFVPPLTFWYHNLSIHHLYCNDEVIAEELEYLVKKTNTTFYPNPKQYLLQQVVINVDFHTRTCELRMENCSVPATTVTLTLVYTHTTSLVQCGRYCESFSGPGFFHHFKIENPY